MGEWVAASRCAGRALEFEPDNAKGLYRRGVACARLGLLDAAEADLEAARVRQPGTADVAQELANVRQRLGEVKGNSRSVPKGFLQRKAGSTSSETGSAECEGPRVADPAEQQQAPP